MNVFKIASNDFDYILREIHVRLIKNKIIKYLNDSTDPEIVDISAFIKNHGISVFPYKYIFEHNISDISVQKDLNNELLYIENDKGMNIYLSRKYKSYFRARRYYNNILIEQDYRSPHCYTTELFKPKENDVILDIGGAEGFFTAEYIDVAKKAYIFECDNKWQEALNITFKEYSNKVEIIPKYVTDNNIDNNISLDEFIELNNISSESLFIKIDAEGYELKILNGLINSLDKLKNIKIVICTYHTSDAEKSIQKYFDRFDVSFSNGYMLYYYDFNFGEPYLRKGVMRIINSN